MQPLLPMDDNNQTREGSKPTREPFTTIDDLTSQAEDLKRRTQALTEGLKKLGAYKHPLGVRRVRKEVISMHEDNSNSQSKQIKAGSRTYFLDIDKTSEGKPYLKIAESRFKKGETQRERQTILVFPEQAQEFAQAVTNMLSQLK
jgi:hypothetical protein